MCRITYKKIESHKFHRFPQIKVTSEEFTLKDKYTKLICANLLASSLTY